LTNFFEVFLAVENSVECVENLENQRQKNKKIFFACGKLFEKTCQVFFENISFSPLCTNRQIFQSPKTQELVLRAFKLGFVGDAFFEGNFLKEVSLSCCV